MCGSRFPVGYFDSDSPAATVRLSAERSQLVVNGEEADFDTVCARSLRKLIDAITLGDAIEVQAHFGVVAGASGGLSSSRTAWAGLRFARRTALIRSSILRASGFIALHDEEKVFAEETDSLRRQADDRRASFLAGLAAFKAVLLEGVEVVFIVTGARPGLLGWASFGALAACLLILTESVTGAAKRKFSRVD